jgi:hypothetical protein
MLLLMPRYVCFFFGLCLIFALYFVVFYFVALSHLSCSLSSYLLALSLSSYLPLLQMRKGSEARIEQRQAEGKIEGGREAEKT